MRISTPPKWKKPYTQPVFELKMKSEVASHVPVSLRQNKLKIMIKEIENKKQQQNKQMNTPPKKKTKQEPPKISIRD